MRNVFFLVFAASGFSGLIYESIWTHYLKLFLGHAAYAQTLVLAIFMGGMAAGSWLSSRYSARWRHLLRSYALAEAIIGVLALAFHPVFDWFVNVAYSTVIPSLGSAAAATAFKWSAGALLILPQSVLLGMTFPLMSAGLLRRYPWKSGETIAMLYFTNSLGGAAGVLASGFWLVKLVGLPGTIGLAGLVNLALAALVWRLAGAEPEARRAETGAAGPRGGAAGLAGYRLLLAASLLTGSASLIYEIGWIRMLSLVLGSSTHAFELMLSAFVLGLALGGLWIRRRIDSIADPIRFLGHVQVVMGLFALATLLVYGRTFWAMHWLLDVLPKNEAGYSWFNLGSHAIAMLVMLPATFCAGMTLPLITFELLRRGRGEASIGLVYAANTLGAIAGIFAAVHLGLPLLGLKGLIAFGSALDIGLGIALLWWGWSRDRLRMPALATALGAGALAVTLLWVQLDPYKLASGVYRAGKLLSPVDAEVVDARDGKTATVHLTREQGTYLRIRTNGKTDASVNMKPGGRPEPDETTMALSGALGLLLNPHARVAANIGFGSGITTHVLLAGPSLSRVDTVEIEPAMVAVAQAFRPRNERAYTDPRSRIHIEDAKTFFSARHAGYDLIISEPSNPWVSGVSGLFTVEFYRMVQRHLNPGGLLVQWLQLYEIDFDLVASVLKALESSFDHYEIYAANFADIHIVAWNGAPVPPPDGSLFREPRLAEELARVGVNNARDVGIRRVATKEMLAPLLARMPIPANSDYRPVLDQNAARARFLRLNARELIGLAEAPVPGLELLGVRPPAAQQGRITPQAYYPVSEAYDAAAVLRDAVAAGSAQDLRGLMAGRAPWVAETLRRVTVDCGDLAIGGNKIDALFNVGVDVVPYLQPDELETVWRWVEGQPCGSGLNALEGDWLGLFKQVGRRNAKEMARLAELLLEREGPHDSRRTSYLVMVAMLGHLAQGDKAAARRIWSLHNAKFSVDARSLMLFRVLIANSFAP